MCPDHLLGKAPPTEHRGTRTFSTFSYRLLQKVAPVQLHQQQLQRRLAPQCEPPRRPNGKTTFSTTREAGAGGAAPSAIPTVEYTEEYWKLVRDEMEEDKERAAAAEDEDKTRLIQWIRDRGLGVEYEDLYRRQPLAGGLRLPTGAPRALEPPRMPAVGVPMHAERRLPDNFAVEEVLARDVESAPTVLSPSPELQLPGVKARNSELLMTWSAADPKVHVEHGGPGRKAADNSPFSQLEELSSSPHFDLRVTTAGGQQKNWSQCSLTSLLGTANGSGSQQTLSPCSDGAVTSPSASAAERHTSEAPASTRKDATHQSQQAATCSPADSGGAAASLEPNCARRSQEALAPALLAASAAAEEQSVALRTRTRRDWDNVFDGESSGSSDEEEEEGDTAAARDGTSARWPLEGLAESYLGVVGGKMKKAGVPLLQRRCAGILVPAGLAAAALLEHFALSAGSGHRREQSPVVPVREEPGFTVCSPSWAVTDENCAVENWDEATMPAPANAATTETDEHEDDSMNVMPATMDPPTRWSGRQTAPLVLTAALGAAGTARYFGH
eukprot:g1711.t1